MAGGFTANLQVEPQKWESPERWPVIIVLVGQEPNMTTGKRPSAKAVQELSQELTYMGISKVVDELICLAYLKSPKSGVGVFDGRFRNDPPCHGHYTWRSWSPILDVRWWPGTLEFPEHTGVPSQDCLIGAERALPMQIWRVYMFFFLGGGEKTNGAPKT